MSYQNPVTENLADFGNPEKHEAGRLLSALGSRKDLTEYIGKDGVKVAFNMNSGYVFLTDEDYNVAMMNGDNLEDWFTCSECGHEGFKDEMQHSPDTRGCREYLRQIGVGQDEEE